MISHIDKQSAKLSRKEYFFILLLFSVLSAFFPYFEKIHSANELSRLYLTNAILMDKTVSIDMQMRRLGNIFDKSLRNGKYYCDKAPGVSFFALPAAWVYLNLISRPTLRGEMRLLRWWVSTLPTAIFLIALLGFLKTYLPDRRLCYMLVAAYALGTLATTYSILLVGHQLSAVLVFSCFLFVRDVDKNKSSWQMLTIGVLSSFAVCVEYQNALLILPLAFYFLYRTKCHPKAIALVFLGALPFICLLSGYHYAAFGSIWSTGYSYIASSFKAVHKQGLMGIALPKWEHLVLSTISPARGIFFFSPFLILAIPGMFFMARIPKVGLISIVMILLYFLFVSSMVYPVGG